MLLAFFHKGAIAPTFFFLSKKTAEENMKKVSELFFLISYIFFQ